MIIDRKFREASWDIENKNQVTTEELTKVGRSDYLLKDRRGRPLAIIEAKHFSIDPESAKQQAFTYAKDLQVMDKKIEQGKRKILLVMATGTGKTLTIAVQIKRMFEAGLIERVLFLVDRIELGKQAQDTFNDVLKDYSAELLYGGRLKRESSIVIGTLSTIYSQLNNFTSGYFDLVISDEAHL